MSKKEDPTRGGEVDLAPGVKESFMCLGFPRRGGD